MTTETKKKSSHPLEGVIAVGLLLGFVYLIWMMWASWEGKDAFEAGVVAKNDAGIAACEAAGGKTLHTGLSMHPLLTKDGEVACFKNGDLAD